MDVKPADEFELEERPDADANADDEFACPPPDASEEIKTALDDDLEKSKSYLERENISAELNRFYETFPDYKVDKILIIRNKKYSLQTKTNRLRIKVKR